MILQAALQLGEAVQPQSALAPLLAPLAAPMQQLAAAIRHCIGAEDGRILDRASEHLAEVIVHHYCLFNVLKTLAQWCAHLHCACKHLMIEVFCPATRTMCASFKSVCTSLRYIATLVEWLF